jgi:hypothetical protein
VKVHNGTGYVMQLLGNDFFFSNADFSFEYIDGMKKSLEKKGPAILGVNSIEFRYATLSEYMQDMAKVNYTIGRYEGDFFVYTQYKPSGYYDHHWGGYFSSRPMFKWMVRDLLARERAMNSMMAVLNFVKMSNPKGIEISLFNSSFQYLKKVREFNPVMLHHDAITGTHGNQVNSDYKRKIQDNHNLMNDSIERLKNAFHSESSIDQTSEEFIFYNPTLYTRREIYNITIPNDRISIVEGPVIDAEIMDSYILDEEKFDQANEFILWIEISVPPLGFSKILVYTHGTRIDCERNPKCVRKVKTEESASKPDLTLSNNAVSVNLRENALEVKSVTNVVAGNTVILNEYLFKYDGSNTNSCIYTFKPTSDATLVNLSSQRYIKFTGKLVNAIQISGNDNSMFFAKTVLIKKGDVAVHISTQNYIK